MMTGMMMMLRLNWLAKLTVAVVLGNIDALVSHGIVKTVPVWFIDLYSIPIEYLIANSVIIGLAKIYKRVKNARTNM